MFKVHKCDTLLNTSQNTIELFTSFLILSNNFEITSLKIVGQLQFSSKNHNVVAVGGPPKHTWFHSASDVDCYRLKDDWVIKDTRTRGELTHGQFLYTSANVKKSVQNKHNTFFRLRWGGVVRCSKPPPWEIGFVYNHIKFYLKSLLENGLT